jgi:hypothetical protein
MPIKYGSISSKYNPDYSIMTYMRALTSLGSSQNPYDANKGEQGDVNKGISKVGAAPKRWAPELSLLFGGDAW